jgi:alpha-tubulin suppressor-like RCC1 family protein
VINLIVLLLMPFAFSISANASSNNVFIESFNLSVGENHVCALTAAGIKCFGNAENVILNAPIKATNPRLIQTGNRFSCVIEDLGVRCWGEIPNNKTSNLLIGKKILKGPRLLGVGYEHACAVSSTDQIKCWGKDTYGEATVPKKFNNITEISLGMNSSCVIAEGVVTCWGKTVGGPEGGQVILKNPRNLTSGWWHHCAQSDEGLKCWGYPYKDFIAVDDDTIKEISSGGFYNCGIAATGVKCWDETGKTILVDDSIGAIKVSVGSNNACAITTDKGVICWKLLLENQKTYKLLKAFVPSGGVDNIEFVSTGHSSTCAYGADGTLKCWGFNPDGALDVPSSLPKPITQLSVGARRTCAISDSVLTCWGGKNNAYNVPLDLGSVLSVSSGGNQICATTAEKMRCWGENIRGALDMPAELNNISQISSGFSHVCAVSNNQTNCWGGNGLIKNVNPPQKLLNPRAICAGGTFSCAISSEGRIECWGDKIEFNGEAKISEEKTNLVLAIPPELQGADVAEISCGLSHACAIYNGKVKCWGNNTFLPERLTAPIIKNPRNLSAGWNHTCALGDNGLNCWGAMLNIGMPSYSLEK